MFVHFNGIVINSDDIKCIVYADFAKDGWIRVESKDGESFLVEGPEAFNLMMRLCPDALEGELVKYKRHAWAIHNLIGHPLMQIFSWLHLTEVGLKIHDATVPNPITK